MDNSSLGQASNELGADGSAAAAVASSAEAPGAEQIREMLEDKYVCPFCGSINDAEQGVCGRCSMENSPASRKATKCRIGPWYVLQTRNPAAPGMRFETLIGFARKGRVKPKSIVRGPTTHQLWKFAAHVKGLSREFGVCYSCGSSIDPGASLCPMCNRLQDPPPNPDVLLETRDAPAPSALTRTRFKEPDLSEIDSEFVIPALGSGSDDSVSGMTLTGSMAGVAFDPGSWTRDPATPRPAAAAPNAYAPNSYPPASPASPGRRKDNNNEGFLTPKDLAAAFQLDFSPSANGVEADAAGRPTPGDRRRGARGAPAAPREPRNPRANRPAREARVPAAPRPTTFEPAWEAPLDPGAFDPGAFDPAALAGAADAPAPAKPFAPPAPRPRRHRTLKAFAFVLLFGGAMYGVALYADDTVRQQSRQWYGQIKTLVVQTINGSPAPLPRRPGDARAGDPLAPARPIADNAPAPQSPAPADVPGSAPEPVTPATLPTHPAAPVGPPPVSPPPAPAAPVVPAATAVSAPTTAPVAAPVASATLFPVPAAARESARAPAAPAPAPQAPARASQPPPAQTASAQAGSVQAFQPVLDPAAESLKLWRQGLSLESTNPAKALASYKSIKQYPPAVWPRDLDVCIRRAEHLMKIQQ